MPRVGLIKRPPGSEELARGFVDKDLWLWVKTQAVKKSIEHGDFIEPGLRIVKAVLEAGRVPDDLGYLLQERDPEALRQLQMLLDAKARAEPARG